MFVPLAGAFKALSPGIKVCAFYFVPALLPAHRCRRFAIIRPCVRQLAPFSDRRQIIPVYGFHALAYLLRVRAPDSPCKAMVVPGRVNDDKIPSVSPAEDVTFFRKRGFV